MLRSLLPAVVLSLCCAGTGIAEVCDWESYASAPYKGMAFPDLNAKYWRIQFGVGGPLELEKVIHIRGKPVNSRYFSFTTYDAPSNAILSHVADTDLTRKDGDYDIYIGLPQAIAAAKQILENTRGITAGMNFLPVEPQGRRLPRKRGFELWYRVYLENTGRKGLPAAEMLYADAASNEFKPAACTANTKRPAVPISALPTIPPLNKHHEIKFYHIEGTSLYPNPHNQYLASRLNPRDGRVATIEFRPPPPGSMRYWSICLGGLSTTTSGCLHDQEILAANDLDGTVELPPEARVRVMIGPESLRRRAQQEKVAFLPWGDHYRQFIIYRNLLADPDFEGNMRLVPPWTKGGESADRFIADWAPTGGQF